MKLLVTTDAHLFRTSDKKVWCKAIYGYNFWKRYLDVFDEVRIVARLKEVKVAENNWVQVDGDGIEIYGIPFYQGPLELMRNFVKVKKSIKNVYKSCDAALFRLPSPTGQLIYKEKKNNIPIAAEIVFDPTDNLNSSQGNIFNRIINKITVTDLKKICSEINGVSYVTAKTIQKNFPSYVKLNGADNFHFESYYSSINLSKEAFQEPKKFVGKTSFTIAHSNVAMNGKRKGELILLEAIKLIREKGYEVNCVFIGDGVMRREFEMKATDLGINNFVEFIGLLSSSNAVRQVLTESDIYVLPTQAEGLPRGILEAMAVGLPCISSPVGGIPEILEKQYLVNPNNPSDVAKKVIQLISSPVLMEKASIENFEKAKLYRNDVLQRRRNDFYMNLKRLIN